MNAAVNSVEIASRMADARMALVLDQPFFGFLAMKLRVVEDAAMAQGTAATDGRCLYYAPDFIATLTQAQTCGLFAHEVLHCALHHTHRRGMREPRRWNVACDYPINSLVLGAGMRLPPDGCVDDELGALSAEEVYERLPEGVEGPAGGLVLDAPAGASGDGEGAEALAEEWKVALVQAAKVARAAGQLPAGIETLVADTLAARVDWRAVLRRFIVERTKADYSWTRPNRRYLAHGMILPGLHSLAIGTITIAIDTSGSTDGDREMFIAEMRAIQEDTRPERMTVLHCDAAVHRIEDYGPDEPFDPHFAGGGGTSFRPVFEAIAERGDAPACLIYLTDGEGRFPAAAPDYPVLWIMTTSVVAPFGETVRIGVG